MQETSQVQTISKPEYYITPENYRMSVQKWTEIIQELEGKLSMRTVYECGFCEEFMRSSEIVECALCPLYKVEMCINNATEAPNEAEDYAFWIFNRNYNNWKYHGLWGKEKEEARQTALHYAKIILAEIQKYNPQPESSWDVL